MKPRLFWTILLAFVLVIVLGICGMLGFFGLAFAGIWQPGELRGEFQNPQRAYVETLADYYAAHGSWTGVERRLSSAPFGVPASLLGYALADADGRVVASNDADLPPGRSLEANLLTRGTPVNVKGTRIGTFVLLRPTQDFRPGPAPGRPPDFVWSILRGFLFAGVGLASLLLVLAVVFARRLSRPLRGLTAAAQSLAAGQLDVQVHGAAVRELDELAHAFNSMARTLAQADRQRRQMTADIAHELRTPLTIIKGRLEGLQDGVYSPTPEEIGRLLDETALLERLIEDLRLLTMAEAGRLPLYIERLDPHEIMKAAAAAFQGQAVAQGVALCVTATGDLPEIEADPQRMAQVFTNLLSNALRYTPAGGTITLSACQDKEIRGQGDRDENKLLVPVSPGLPVSQGSVVGGRWLVVFTVSDTGQGIAPQDLPHIFDRFYRADPSRARGSGGAGLGLAIVKQIVAAHSGTIWAESTEGQGTSIRFALPVYDARD